MGPFSCGHVMHLSTNLALIVAFTKLREGNVFTGVCSLGGEGGRYLWTLVSSAGGGGRYTQGDRYPPGKVYSG